MKTQHACSSLRENFENKLAAAERSQRILVDLEKASKQRILKEMEQVCRVFATYLMRENCNHQRLNNRLHRRTLSTDSLMSTGRIGLVNL